MIDFFSLFTEPIFYMIAALFAGVGAVIGYTFLQPTPGNQVRFFMPKTKTAYDIPVETESANILYGEEISGYPIKRFYKEKDGYDVRAGKKVFTSYLGTEGRITTTAIAPFSTNIATSDWLNVALGDEIFKKLTENEKTLLRLAKIPITVDIEKDYPSDSPDWLNKMTEDDFRKKLREKAAQDFTESAENAKAKGGWKKVAETIFIMGTGAALTMAAFILKFLKI